ncbi:MAG: hypothetical protein ACE5E7_06500 [Anaerolineae bacterium]
MMSSLLARQRPYRIGRVVTGCLSQVPGLCCGGKPGLAQVQAEAAARRVAADPAHQRLALLQAMETGRL